MIMTTMRQAIQLCERAAGFGGFDTKIRRTIEHGVEQLQALAKKKAAGEDVAQDEDAVLTGLLRVQAANPRDFLYSVLEILGARGKYPLARAPMQRGGEE